MSFPILSRSKAGWRVLWQFELPILCPFFRQADTHRSTWQPQNNELIYFCAVVLYQNRAGIFDSFPQLSLSSCPVMVIPSPTRGTPAEKIHWVGGLKGAPLGFIAGFGQPGTNNASSVRLCPWQWAYIVGSPISVPPGEISSTCDIQTLSEGHS